MRWSGVFVMVFDSEWYVTNMMEDTVGYSGNFELNNSTPLRHVRCFFLLLSDFFTSIGLC